MTEPPKPITRLAEPIDRTGSRGRNRLGDAALRLVIWTWPLAFSISLLAEQVFSGYWPASSWVAHRIAEIMMFWFVPLCCITAEVMGIVALVKARNRHLRYVEAIMAMAMAAAGIGLWYAWIGRPYLAFLF
jgi:hypothetical protein